MRRTFSKQMKGVAYSFHIYCTESHYWVYKCCTMMKNLGDTEETESRVPAPHWLTTEEKGQ